MPTLKLNYPVFVWNNLEIEVTEEEALTVENMSLAEQAKFICHQHENHRQSYVMPTERNLESALDIGFATIKRQD